MVSKAKVLYVDDEPLNLKLFEINFNSVYKVLTASEGQSGLMQLEENPDTFLIISDMKMPGMNGIEFIKKAKEKYPDKKYYIVTGFEITGEIREALNSGLILEYFNKPYEIDKIHDILAEALKD